MDLKNKDTQLALTAAALFFLSFCCCIIILAVLFIRSSTPQVPSSTIETYDKPKPVVSKPVKPIPQYIEIKKFTGRTLGATDKFEITGNRFKIVYKVTDETKSVGCHFQGRNISTGLKNLLGNKFADEIIEGTKTQEIVVYERGTQYLNIISVMCSWEITIYDYK